MNKLRQRAIRLACSALFGHVEDRDLSVLIAELMDDQTFGQDLATMLARLTEGVTRSEDVKVPSGRAEPKPTPLLDAALQVLQKRRVSKSQLLSLIGNAGYAVKLPLPIVGKMSTREILRRFFLNASSSELDEFLRSLDLNSSDPYLQGIVDPKRRPT